MIKLFIIFFREILEVSLLLGIISAATQELRNRSLYIALGLVAGITGSLVIAKCADAIFEAFNGYGQEISNAIILLVSASMIVYTVVWMSNAHHKTKSKLYQIDSSSENFSLISISIITATAVLREGTEIALFSYGIITSSTESNLSLLSGAIFGSLAAIITGALLYKGIIEISGKYLFKVTSIMLSLIAAGLTAQAANLLLASEIITHQDPLWNSSWIISQRSLLGKILNTIVGYVDNPTPLEIAFYLGTLAIVYIFAKKQKIAQN